MWLGCSWMGDHMYALGIWASGYDTGGYSHHKSQICFFCFFVLFDLLFLLLFLFAVPCTVFLAPQGLDQDYILHKQPAAQVLFSSFLSPSQVLCTHQGVSPAHMGVHVVRNYRMVTARAMTNMTTNDQESFVWTSNSKRQALENTPSNL